MSHKKKKSSRGKPGPYSFEFRLRVVRMYLEEQYPKRLICEEAGTGLSTLVAWTVNQPKQWQGCFCRKYQC